MSRAKRKLKVLPQVTFFGATLNGKTPAAVNAESIDMVTGKRVVQIATGPLNSDGVCWTASFEHS